ncbi:MAG: Crp/Fnr family transcriptional regulator [Acidobacteria bacterium]|nr:MAG: Crp/Fnr family transcriptional regulator [Acidobacteriota bacterium]
MQSGRCRRCRIPKQCPFRIPELLFEKIQALIEWRWYSANYTVFKHNQPAEGLYLVQAGRLGLYIEAKGKKTHLGNAVAGWILGAGETLESSSYLYTAETEEETELEFLAKESLLSLLSSYPEVVPPLLATVAQRSNELIAQMLRARW